MHVWLHFLPWTLCFSDAPGYTIHAQEVIGKYIIIIAFLFVCAQNTAVVFLNKWAYISIIFRNKGWIALVWTNSGSCIVSKTKGIFLNIYFFCVIVSVYNVCIDAFFVLCLVFSFRLFSILLKQSFFVSNAWTQVLWNKLTNFGRNEHQMAFTTRLRRRKKNTKATNNEKSHVRAARAGTFSSSSS